MRIISFLVTCIFIFSQCKKDNESIQKEELKTYKDQSFTAHFKRTSGIVAADAAVSVNLNNGKSLWLFGDSYIDNYDPASKTVPCLFQVRNAGMVMSIPNPAEQPTTLLGNGSPRSYFAVGSGNSAWFWPGAGYVAGDTVYTFLSRIRSTGGTGGFAFEEVDSQYVAKSKVSELSKVSYVNLGPKAKISFTNGTVSADGFIYVYGIKENGLGRDLIVARYPQNNLYTAWEYWTKDGWNKNINSAEKIHREFTSSFHVVKIKNKYLLVTTELSTACNQGKEIYSYISDNPFGPFSNKKTIWTVDDTLEGNLPFFYLAYIHPEYDNGKDEVLITYCINGYSGCVVTCKNNRLDPDVYRPRAIRVPYSSIGIK